MSRGVCVESGASVRASRMVKKKQRERIELNVSLLRPSNVVYLLVFSLSKNVGLNKRWDSNSIRHSLFVGESLFHDSNQQDGIATNIFSPLLAKIFFKTGEFCGSNCIRNFTDILIHVSIFCTCSFRK